MKISNQVDLFTYAFKPYILDLEDETKTIEWIIEENYVPKKKSNY